MEKDKQESVHPISESHLREIGAIVVIWSHIEQAMEVAICNLYDINVDRGLVLTSNIGFISRVALLRILARRGAIKDKELAADMVEILKRISDGYSERNAAAHSVWSGTSDASVARRMSIRAKGDRLRCSNDLFHVDQLSALSGKLDKLRIDFAGILIRLNLGGAKIG